MHVQMNILSGLPWTDWLTAGPVRRRCCCLQAGSRCIPGISPWGTMCWSGRWRGRRRTTGLPSP